MMARSGDSDVIGLIAIAVGGLLVLGALTFLAVTLLMSGVSRVVLIPPVVQILLGCLGSVAGFLLRQGHTRAKFALAFVGIGVVANLVLLAAIAVAAIH
jgi:hypothetical protein